MLCNIMLNSPKLTGKLLTLQRKWQCQKPRRGLQNDRQCGAGTLGQYSNAKDESKAVGKLPGSVQNFARRKYGTGAFLRSRNVSLGRY